MKLEPNSQEFLPYKDVQFFKFCTYGFLKNLKFFDPFLILFFREIGLTFFKIGILYSVRELVINLTEIPTGYIADRIGRKKALLSAFIFYILSFILFYGFGQYFVVSILAMIFFGLGETFRSGTHKAMILEYLKIKNQTHLKLEYYGKTRSWSQLGSAVSSLIAGGLVFYTGSFRVIFLASTIPYILDFLLILSYPSYLDGTVQTDKQKSENFFFSMFRDLVGLFKNASLRKVLLNTSMVNAAFKIGKDYLQPIVKNWIIWLPMMTWMVVEKKTAVLLGLIYFLIYLVGSYFSRNADRFVKKLGSNERALNILYGATWVLFLCIGIAYHFFPLIAILLFFVFHIIQNLQKPVMVASVSDFQSNNLLATILSLQNELRAMIAAILAPFLGYLVDIWGIANAFLIVSVLFALIAPFVKLGTKNRNVFSG